MGKGTIILNAPFTILTGSLHVHKSSMEQFMALLRKVLESDLLFLSPFLFPGNLMASAEEGIFCLSQCES